MPKPPSPTEPDTGISVRRTIDQTLADPDGVGSEPNRRNADMAPFGPFQESLFNLRPMDGEPGHLLPPDPFTDRPLASGFVRNETLEFAPSLPPFADDPPTIPDIGTAGEAPGSPFSPERPRRPERPSSRRRQTLLGARGPREPTQDATAIREGSIEPDAPASDVMRSPPPTDPADWADASPFDPVDVHPISVQEVRGQAASPGLSPHAHEIHQWWDPLRDHDAVGMPGQRKTAIDWTTVASEFVGTALIGIGAGVGIGLLIGAGIISAPFALAAGVGLLAIGGTRAFFSRADHAFDVGAEEFTGRAMLAAAGDPVGITPLYEGIHGQDVVTREQLGSYERSTRLGQGAGAVATVAAGRRPLRFGMSMGQRGIQAGFIDPYTVPSISRPTGNNPLVLGTYTTPQGVVLVGNHPVAAVRAGVTTYRSSGLSGRPRLRAAWGAATRAYEGRFKHIMRHFEDQPGRANRNNYPQIHSVFDESLKPHVIRLIDDAFVQGTAPNGLGLPQGNRFVLVALSDGQVGRSLGNPQYYTLTYGNTQHYGASLDSFVLVLDQQTYAAVTMFPGIPPELGPRF